MLAVFREGIISARASQRPTHHVHVLAISCRWEESASSAFRSSDTDTSGVGRKQSDTFNECGDPAWDGSTADVGVLSGSAAVIGFDRSQLSAVHGGLVCFVAHEGLANVALDSAIIEEETGSSRNVTDDSRVSNCEIAVQSVSQSFEYWVLCDFPTWPR